MLSFLNEFSHYNKSEPFEIFHDSYETHVCFDRQIKAWVEEIYLEGKDVVDLSVMRISAVDTDEVASFLRCSRIMAIIKETIIEICQARRAVMELSYGCLRGQSAQLSNMRGKESEWEKNWRKDEKYRKEHEKSKEETINHDNTTVNGNYNILLNNIYNTNTISPSEESLSSVLAFMLWNYHSYMVQANKEVLELWKIVYEFANIRDVRTCDFTIVLNQILMNELQALRTRQANDVSLLTESPLRAPEHLLALLPSAMKKPFLECDYLFHGPRKPLFMLTIEEEDAIFDSTIDQDENDELPQLPTKSSLQQLMSHYSKRKEDQLVNKDSIFKEKLMKRLYNEFQIDNSVLTDGEEPQKNYYNLLAKLEIIDCDRATVELDNCSLEDLERAYNNIKLNDNTKYGRKKEGKEREGELGFEDYKRKSYEWVLGSEKETCPQGEGQGQRVEGRERGKKISKGEAMPALRGIISSANANIDGTSLKQNLTNSAMQTNLSLTKLRAAIDKASTILEPPSASTNNNLPNNPDLKIPSPSFKKIDQAVIKLTKEKEEQLRRLSALNPSLKLKEGSKELFAPPEFLHDSYREYFDYEDCLDDLEAEEIVTIVETKKNNRKKKKKKNIVIKEEEGTHDRVIVEAIEGGGIKETAAAEVLVVDLRSPEEKILFEYLENLEINDSERIECKVDEAYKSRWLSKIASIQTGTTIKYTPYDTDMSIQPTQPHSQNKMREIKSLSPELITPKKRIKKKSKKGK